MIDFKNSSILDIIPVNYKEHPEVIALAYALQMANKRFTDMADMTRVFSVIDTLPEKIIDVLAIELRTQYYDDTFPLEKKRELVKATMPWYAHAGTTAAVQEMIDKVFGTGMVLEWFDTGDDPGTFTISTTGAVTPETLEEFRTVVSKVKNVRSLLKKISVGNRAEFNYYGFLGVCAHHKIILHD